LAQLQPQFRQVQGLQRQPPLAEVQAQGALALSVIVFLHLGRSLMPPPRITL